MSDAKVLREAAALMRKRAKAAWPSPWLHMGILGTDYNDIVDAPGVAGRVAETDDNTENAAHIASWHPDVALAVANLLVGTADFIEGSDEGLFQGLPDSAGFITWPLAIARAYLGEPA